MINQAATQFWVLSCLILLEIVSLSGCGTTLTRGATEQLLISDAVDQTVARLDFSALSGKTVYLDTRYIKNVKGMGFVNADYIISSLRQQMTAANCLLQDKLADADYVVEARIGALGTNSHEVSYGLPQSTSVSTAYNTAASMVPTVPALPPLPELSVAKKNDQSAAAKISLFAYNRQTKHPVWQSGISRSVSTAGDTWVFGVGPFQRGSIHKGTQFAGTRLGFPFLNREKQKQRPQIAYKDEHLFDEPPQKTESQSSESDHAESQPPAPQPEKPTDAEKQQTGQQTSQPKGGTANDSLQAKHQHLSSWIDEINRAISKPNEDYEKSLRSNNDPPLILDGDWLTDMPKTDNNTETGTARKSGEQTGKLVFPITDDRKLFWIGSEVPVPRDPLTPPPNR